MLTVEKNDFLNAIKAVKSFSGKVNLNPILSTIHLKTENGGITLITTDTNNSAKTTCDANITSDFDICVNAINLENIINRMDEIITMEVKESMLIVKSNNAEFKLLCLQSKDFPNINFNLEGKNVLFEANSFCSGVNKTAFSSATDSYNVLSGICFSFDEEYCELASTDGNRLSIFKTNSTHDLNGSKYVIPSKLLYDVSKNAKNSVNVTFVQIGINQKVKIETNNCTYLVSLVNGVFPKYEQLIPTSNNKIIKLERQKFINVLEKIAIMSDNRTNIVLLNFENNALEISAKCDNGSAKDVLDIDFDDNLKIAFNYKYLLDVLRAFDDNDFILKIKDETSACILQDSTLLHLIMPCNIKNS